ncbi:hypothetical protein [Xanthomonas cannabis]|uniref:hypothetical protein n=1 Tax=Xanthomonas TaxID=338 RepID=UPI0005752E02|nr:hypothetical protein [Xanthomonas cannabis]KHL57620.1 hypothetical protein OZ13_06235 [Xanthomonas cannabis pv. cannabis]KHL60019.1 hypothetical protein OZ10_00730 [Xanthomonas cannabis pv. cannabis]MCC4610514.1 hypothetical protein [Xanthomonas campestris pv. esculenti]
MTDFSIKLTVARVGFGGNTGAGEYFYSFAPDLLIVDKDDGVSTLTYHFEEDVVPKHFIIKSLLTTDAFKQIGDPVIAPDGRSVEVVNANSVPTLIFLTIIVEDPTRTDKKGNKVWFSCDPQVGNDPKINPQEVPPINKSR